MPNTQEDIKCHAHDLVECYGYKFVASKALIERCKLKRLLTPGENEVLQPNEERRLMALRVK